MVDEQSRNEHCAARWRLLRQLAGYQVGGATVESQARVRTSVSTRRPAVRVALILSRARNPSRAMACFEPPWRSTWNATAPAWPPDDLTPMMLDLRIRGAAAARLLLAAGRAAVVVGAFALTSATVHAEACIGSWSARWGTATLDDQIRAAVRDDAGNVYLGGYEGGKLGVENFWPVGDAKGFVEKHGADGARLWRHEFDTSATDIVEALALDASGRVAVAGRTDGSFPGMVNGGQFDLFVALLDGDGNLLSLTQTGNERPQHPAAIALADNGDIVVVGYDDEFVVGNAVIAWQNGFVGRFRVGPADSIDLVSWSA